MKTIYKHLYFWVLVGIFAGGLLGAFKPEIAVELKPLSDGFISLIKMMIGPIIFCTVVLGISGAGDMKKVGRIGVKALLYFEVVSTVALLIGLLVVNIIRPGAGFNADPSTLDASAVSEFSQKASHANMTEVILHIIPKSFFDAFTGSGDMLQVLLVSILFGYAMLKMGNVGLRIHPFIEECSHIFFAIMAVIMKLAPIGAGSAMAFTIGKFGLAALKPLLALMGTFYLTCFIFIFAVLGLILFAARINIFQFLKYIRHELLLVLGTSSSESALVPLMAKLEKLGCSRSVVGLVIPSGYSFNLDGTNIYLTMAVLFIAQATNVDLSLQQQLAILGVAMLTSKGASGVTGAGFITLAATLAVVPSLPISGLALILGIDRFMSEARSITNFIGNGVGALVISKWEKELDFSKLREELKSVKGR
jgi:aerobic C4-dicarboxylate transport protein